LNKKNKFFRRYRGFQRVFDSTLGLIGVMHRKPGKLGEIAREAVAILTLGLRLRESGFTPKVSCNGLKHLSHKYPRIGSFLQGISNSRLKLQGLYLVWILTATFHSPTATEFRQTPDIRGKIDASQPFIRRFILLGCPRGATTFGSR
jgi:hypothetical protein